MPVITKKALIIFTRLPIPGKTKTRLSPQISLEFSAELHKSFLLDILDIAYSLNDIEIFLAYFPPEPSHSLQNLINKEVILIPQKGDDLGLRMHNAFLELHSIGYEKIVLIGSDSPTIQKRHINLAFNKLKNNDVVIGPSADGGYYLIGLKKPNQKLFIGINWGTKEVFKQTLLKIRNNNLSLELLEPWYDVDTPSDLKFLLTHINYLKTSSNYCIPERTMKLLNKYFE
jgi:rSAM/selenodomain-associated transferase 1